MLGWHPQPDCFPAEVRIASADKGLLIRRAAPVTSCWGWRPPLRGSNGLASSCAPPSTPPDLRLTASQQRRADPYLLASEQAANFWWPNVCRSHPASFAQGLLLTTIHWLLTTWTASPGPMMWL